MASDEQFLTDIEFVAFDLETTGLFPVACRIVEFGAVRFRLDGEEIGRFEQLVDPECEIPAAATRVNGITAAMTRGKPTIDQVLPGFLEFLRDPACILMAHNAPFDLGFLGVATAQFGLDSSLPPVIDTRDLAEQLLWDVPNYRLETIAVRLGVASGEDHRALSDSLLLKSVFRELVQGRADAKTTEDLFQLCLPLGCEDAGALAIEPPPGYEELGLAMETEQTVVMVYEGGTKGLTERRITPRALLQSRGRAYINAYCHVDDKEKMFRLDRIQAFRLEGE